MTTPRKTVRPVILSGGVGSRLFPLSSDARPKHFQALISERSMLQDTVLRVGDRALFGEPIVVSSLVHAEETARHLAEIAVTARLLLEPLSRGTAAAVALAAIDLAERGCEDDVMLVLPADHMIADIDALNCVIGVAAELARSGQLVALGIQPTEPHTGYGYIRRGAEIPQGSCPAFLIDSFKEKPDLATARGYLAAGDHLWNAGIFVFRAADVLDELSELCPEILAAVRAAYLQGEVLGSRLIADRSSFESCPPGSFDVCVMERTRRGAVVPAAIGWSDVGSWNALWRIGDKDADGNLVTGDVIALDSRGCYLRSDGLTLAAIGLEDLVIVAAGQTVLIARRDATEEVRAIYEGLKQRALPAEPGEG